MKDIDKQIATLRAQVRALEHLRAEKMPWAIVHEHKSGRLAVRKNSPTQLRGVSLMQRFKTEIAARHELMRRAKQLFKSLQKEQRKIEIAVEEAQEAFEDAERDYWTAVNAKEDKARCATP